MYLEQMYNTKMVINLTPKCIQKTDASNFIIAIEISLDQDNSITFK